MGKYKVKDFCNEANGVIKGLANENADLYRQRNELLKAAEELTDRLIEEVEDTRCDYCFEINQKMGRLLNIIENQKVIIMANTEGPETFEDMRKTLEDTEDKLEMVCRMFQETYHDALELREQRDELLSFIGSIYHRLTVRDFEDEEMLSEIADFYQKYDKKIEGDN